MIYTSAPLLTAALLGLAVLAAWAPPLAGRWPLWPWLAGATVALGVASGVFGVWAVLVVAALAASVYGLGRMQDARWRTLLTTLAGLLALALALHGVPGVSNPVLARNLQVSTGAVPFSVWMSLDKGLAGLLLLGLCPLAASRAGWREVARALSFAAPLTVAGVVGVSLAAGLVRWDPRWASGWPDVSAPFLIGNLLFTCVAEEVFFRGLIQARLQSALAGYRAGPLLAVLVSAILFGAAHLGGGPLYAAIATLAGVGYGCAFARNGRIEAAILTHFLVNLVHFVGFTYPYLQR